MYITKIKKDQRTNYTDQKGVPSKVRVPGKSDWRDVVV